MHNSKNPIIEVKNLSKSFGKGEAQSNALYDINLKIYSRDYVILFGPSGCGKSTLLNCIAGLEVPTKGEVMIRHKDLKAFTEEEISLHRRKKIGMIFQQFNVLKSMSILDNVALPQLFQGTSVQLRQKRAMKLLRIVGLEKVANRIPTEISGGQQQRVAIARSLVNNPWIILADEPTGNLDSKSADEVMDLVYALNEKSHRTIILVTHNPDYLAYGKRVIYMKDGRIVKETKREKVTHKIKTHFEGLEKIDEKHEEV